MTQDFAQIRESEERHYSGILGFARKFASHSTNFYRIPSIPRRVYNHFNADDSSWGESFGTWTGCLLGLALINTNIGMAFEMPLEGELKTISDCALLFPLVTNLISLGYEAGKCAVTFSEKKKRLEGNL